MGRLKFGPLTREVAWRRTRRPRRLCGVSSGCQSLGRMRDLRLRERTEVYQSIEKPRVDEDSIRAILRICNKFAHLLEIIFHGWQERPDAWSTT